jgi:DNA-binding protein HU-beta
MTKKEFITSIADKTNMTSSVVEVFFDATTQTMQEAFLADEEVTFPNLGKFISKVREERIGRNPKTGEALTIPRKKVVAFKAAKAMQEALNQE